MEHHPEKNIIVLLSDDQRYDTIAAWGNKDIITPNLDFLAKNGTSFTQTHVFGGLSGAICQPSRAMLLTGRTLLISTDKHVITMSLALIFIITIPLFQNIYAKTATKPLALASNTTVLQFITELFRTEEKYFWRHGRPIQYSCTRL
jgi:hypothetical protein